jgi:hypothetical protein
VRRDRLCHDGPDRPQQLHFLVANRLGAERHGRFHGHEGEHLQQVILDHVAQGAGFLVIAATRAHALAFAHGDLDMIHCVPRPQPLKDCVREPEHQDVLHRLLPQIVVNAQDLALMHVARQRGAEPLGGGKILSEWLSTDALPERRASSRRTRPAASSCASTSLNWLGEMAR